MSFGRTQEDIRENDARRQAHGREMARAAATNSGKRPDETYEPEALAFIFDGYEHELGELNTIAARFLAREQISEATTARRSAVRVKADAIEQEWRDQARAAAEAEAERRIAEAYGPDQALDVDTLAAQILAQANQART